MSRARLSLEALAVIAAAPADAQAADLARELGCSASLVAWHLSQFRRAGGWYCVLKLPPCTECCQLVIGPPKQITHTGCVPARKARWVRDQRQRFRSTAEPAVAAAVRTSERARVRGYYHALPEERRAELVEHWHATSQRDYELTLEVADQRRAHWSDDDDRYILANQHQPGRELALALGRTLWAVYARRQKLRREAAVTPPRDVRGGLA